MHISDNRAVVRYEPYDNERPIKNLGWLLRHADEAQHVEVFGTVLYVSGREWKHPRRTWVYEVEFASRSVLLEWIERRALAHCKFDVS